MPTAAARRGSPVQGPRGTAGSGVAVMGIDSGYPDELIEPFTIRLDEDTDVSVTPALDDKHGPVYFVDFTRRRHLPRREVWPAELARRVFHALAEAMPTDVTPGNRR